ncbi:MAG: sulfotransferase [Bacteroidetes bacterium]|nr:sulfotransferase [Bacteroidota bacterium]
MSSENYNRNVLRAEGLIPPPGLRLRLTAEQRMLPSFFIIGVQKGGTSAMSEYLSAHPQLVRPQRKDIYFFNNAENYAKGMRWYRAHFAHPFYSLLKQWRTGTKVKTTFDATPNYFAAPGAAERLHTFFPDAKLVLLLRNPVQRAWSNWRMNRRHGFEPLGFEEALQAEHARIAAEDRYAVDHGTHSYVRQRMGYRTNGVYVNFMREWLQYFPAGRFFICTTEEMEADTARVYQALTDFLELDRFNGVQFIRHNEGGERDKMPQQVYEELSRFFAPHNRELEQLLGRKMNWEE